MAHTLRNKPTHYGHAQTSHQKRPARQRGADNRRQRANRRWFYCRHRAGYAHRSGTARLVNEGQITDVNVLIEDGFIAAIGPGLPTESVQQVIDANGKYLLPGIIDDQVHFREPGLTHKAHIASEARAAVAGGVTSFMEMPNTVPNALTQELLADKYAIARMSSLANYSFFMGVSNHNLTEVLKTDPQTVCGVKVFMGASTGDMLVDDKHRTERAVSRE